jgi:hypothetical protein
MIKRLKNPEKRMTVTFMTMPSKHSK